MIEQLEARGAALAKARVAAVLDRIAAAELPPGLVAEREDGAVVIRGSGVARQLAFDARLSAIGLIARGG
jgi:hypothetical protein